MKTMTKNKINKSFAWPIPKIRRVLYFQFDNNEQETPTVCIYSPQS